MSRKRREKKVHSPLGFFYGAPVDILRITGLETDDLDRFLSWLQTNKEKTMWLLLHNNDDQGALAMRRAKNAGLDVVEVELPVGPTGAYQGMIQAADNIEEDTYRGIIYSGHGRNNGKRFLATNGNNLRTQNFARLLGLARPPRIIFFSCFGGSVIQNNLPIFRAVDDIEVDINGIKHTSLPDGKKRPLANLIGCQVEGPTNAILGGSIQPDMEKLVENQKYQPFRATGYTATL